MKGMLSEAMHKTKNDARNDVQQKSNGRIALDEKIHKAEERRSNTIAGVCSMAISAFATTCVIVVLCLAPSVNGPQIGLAMESSENASGSTVSEEVSQTDESADSQAAQRSHDAASGTESSASASTSSPSAASSASSASASSPSRLAPTSVSDSDDTATASASASKSSASSAGGQGSASAKVSSGKWTPVEALESGELDEGGWTETVVHPAVVEHVPAYDSYVCDDCGAETRTLQDMKDHIRETGHSGYTVVHHEAEDVVVEEEWTETVNHDE